MEKQELIDLVIKIQNVEGTEKEIDEMIELSVSDPEAIDYIFSKKFEGWSAENIVEKALEYKAQQLPAGTTSEEE